MKPTITCLAWLFCLCIANAQVKYETFNSNKLEEKRKLKIQLPRDYEEDAELRYPVVIVLDGDYLFEPVAGNVDYLSYWEEMPEAIVVGIMQNGTRDEDCFYDDTTYLPKNKGSSFFEFIGLELMPYLDANFRTAPFRIVVGHDYTANFLNYYVLKDNPLFSGYVNLSPDLAPKMEERVLTVLKNASTKIWYYNATGTNDIKGIRNDVVAMDKKLKAIENPNLIYNFNNFPEGTHYTVCASGIPIALTKMFSIYPPISKKEYKEVVTKLEDQSPYDYLVEKYSMIENLFGVKKQIRINDFLAVSTALEKNQDWEALEKLGQLAREHHPNSMLGNYYLGTFYEQVGEPKKAMRTYENGFLQEEVAFLTKDLLLEKIEQIKTDFGY